MFSKAGITAGAVGIVCMNFFGTYPLFFSIVYFWNECIHIKYDWIGKN